MSITKEEALTYHRQGRPGKIAVTPTKPLASQRDLSLAYTPGVAQPVLELERDPLTAYEYTAKGNLVGVVSNGTAILGLGDRGPLASKPVMEGKGVLFKAFADIDVFDIEIDEKDPAAFIEVVAALAPTFGGINLEDIKAPECFEIEQALKERLAIPVFHDDQHGTAIITGAALINGLELTEKDIGAIRMVVSGAGASAISCSEHAVRLGVKREHITLVDSRGVVHAGRKENMNEYKARFARDTPARTLSEAVEGADVFYGLSVADVLKPEMVETMADQPLIFAMANPDPEINYDLAKEARPDAIVATGRSDYPNQINNVLGFPFIFRGALDARATAINEEMKVAASDALAALTKEDVPDSVLHAYGLERLRFGPDYLIPKALDPRVLLWEAPAVARAALETGVAQAEIDLEQYRDELALRQGQGERVRQFIVNRARKAPKRIAFGEGEENKVIRAAARVLEEGIGTPVLLGDPEIVRQRQEELGLAFDVEVIHPPDCAEADQYARAYFELRRRKGMTFARARRQVTLPNVFGPMMVHMADADAYVSGLTYDYPEVIRPALQILHTQEAAQLVAGVYIMIVEDRVYLFSDATVNIEPGPEELAEIALLCADFARQLELEPRVALLSFSNFGSTRHPRSDKVRRAVGILRERRPELAVDGEMQADTAVVEELIDERYPFSQVRDANVLIFPSLEAANVAYKLLDRLGGARAIGPLLLGMGAPVHVLQTGDDVEDIVHVAAVAAVDAQNRQGKGSDR